MRASVRVVGQRLCLLQEFLLPVLLQRHLFREYLVLLKYQRLPARLLFQNLQCPDV